MAISIAKARALCTKAELALVTASSPKNLSGLSAARLKQKTNLARRLRDKWIDQSQQQRRAKQAAQRARSTSPNVRSEQKAKLFAEVLDRFEQQLKKVERSDNGDTKGKPKRSAPSRKVRATKHREARAAAREALKAEREAIASQRPARRAAPKPPSDKQSTARKPAEKEVKKEVTRPKAVKRARKVVVVRKKKAPVASAAATADAPRPASIKKKTLRARTVAKQARVAQSGAVRVQKHLSARGRRTQARRDSRR